MDLQVIQILSESATKFKGHLSTIKLLNMTFPSATQVKHSFCDWKVVVLFGQVVTQVEPNTFLFTVIQSLYAL